MAGVFVFRDSGVRVVFNTGGMKMLQRINQVYLNQFNEVLKEAPLTHIDWGDGYIEPLKEKQRYADHRYEEIGIYYVRILADGVGWIPMTFQDGPAAVIDEPGMTFRCTITQPKVEIG